MILATTTAAAGWPPVLTGMNVPSGAFFHSIGLNSLLVLEKSKPADDCARCVALDCRVKSTGGSGLTEGLVTAISTSCKAACSLEIANGRNTRKPMTPSSTAHKMILS